MPKAFKIYRIVCTLTDKSLVSGSDHPRWYGGRHHATGRDLDWHERGTWTKSGGVFWKTENAVRQHIQNLCHDFKAKSAPHPYPQYLGQMRYWNEVVPGSLDWSRLKYLSVEQFYVTDYSVTKLTAADFMGIHDQQAA